MAEVRKKEKVKKYDIDELSVKKEEKKKKSSNNKSKNNNKNNATNKSVAADKKSLWVRFRIFCHGVKTEFKKVHWPNKKDMVRYSIATIFFVIFLALFFYLIDVIFALVQLMFK